MIYQLLFIFLARIIDVSLGTVRMILVIRGDRLLASIIGFFEILVYTVALGMVVGSLDDPLKLTVFCLGFALGVFCGSVLEERLALGYRLIQVTISRDCQELAEELRAEGYPVTTWEAVGRAGPKMVLTIIIKRNLAKKIADRIYEKVPEAFVVIMEPKQFSGGYIIKK